MANRVSMTRDFTSGNRNPHRDRLLAAVTEISDILRGGAVASAERHSLAPEAIEALRISGLMAALAPTEVGGYQVDPLTEMELIEAISAIDGSTGWTFMIVAGSTARAASMIPDDALGEVFSAPSRMPLIAFQEAPFGNVVEPTPRGLLVNGTWPFCTGLNHADWILAIGKVAEEKSGCPYPRANLLAALVPVSQIRIFDNWEANGLAGTSTFTYQVEDVLVPWHRVWPYPPDAPIRGGPSFCFRRAPIKHIGFALGVASSSLNELSSRFRQRTPAGGQPRGALSIAVARSALSLRATRALAEDVIADSWREATEFLRVTNQTQRQLRATACFATETAAEICRLVTRYGGASLLSRQNQLQRNLYDIQVGLAHAEVNDIALEDFGADLIAEDPNGDEV